MTHRLRIILGVIILTISIALLIWSFRPLEREIHSHPIPPAELQLPTPISLLTQPGLVS